MPASHASTPAYWIEPFNGDADIDGVLHVEARSFSSPWTREMYDWELQNRDICRIFVVRTSDCDVVGFCAFWLVFDEVHINNVAVLPECRGRGMGAALMTRVFEEARRLGARRATLEVRVSNEGAHRFYERLGFAATARRPHYYANPVEDALILWTDL
jgi:ribosomal-protein-alanine N-acetyltransferase